MKGNLNFPLPKGFGFPEQRQPSPTFKPRSLEIGLNQRSRLPKIVISVSSIPPSSSLAAGTAATTIPPV